MSISRRRILLSMWSPFCLLFMLGLNIARSAEAQTYNVLYQFTGSPDGSYPKGGIVMDSSGNLYGTTYLGGSQYQTQFGTVFKLSPSGVETVLHSFPANPTDGYYPFGGLALDSQGNLYGTTSYGGAYGFGTVFKLAQDGTETVLHSFPISTKPPEPADGIILSSGLVIDSQGSLYGTTLQGGSYGFGTVFKVAPDGTETVFHSFNEADGSYPGQSITTEGALGPSSRLIIDAQGNLYGATFKGGAFGGGTVFKLAPDGTETVLHSFNIGDNGDPVGGTGPNGGVLVDSQGNVYGTTAGGGSNFGGVAFKVAPNGAETVLYNFGPVRTAASFPLGSLLMDKAGNIYGTALGSGDLTVAPSVFQLMPSGVLKTLYAFTGKDGSAPIDSLLMDAEGDLYGATPAGAGSNQNGVIFKVTPPITSVATPTFSLATGTYPSPQSVVISDATPAATLYYTTDGSTPTARSGAVYGSPVIVTASSTLQAIAILPGYPNSAVSTVSYGITNSSCVIIDNSSGVSGSGLSLNGGATVGDGVLLLTDGGLNEARSAFTSTLVPVESFSTDITFQLENAVAEGLTFTIQGNTPQALGAGSTGLGYQGIPNSAAIKLALFDPAVDGHDSTGLYVGGSAPTTPALDLSGAGLFPHNGHIFAVHVDYINGVASSTIRDTVTGAFGNLVLQGYVAQSGEKAYVGFTASTGAQSSAVQKILTWKYQGGTGCPAR